MFTLSFSILEAVKLLKNICSNISVNQSRVVFWLCFCIGIFQSIYHRIIGVELTGYGWKNALRNAWTISEDKTILYDYFRDPLYSLLINGYTQMFVDYWHSSIALGWSIWIFSWLLMCLIVHRLGGIWGNLGLVFVLSLSPILLSIPITMNTYPLSGLAFLLIVFVSLWGYDSPSSFRIFIFSVCHGIALAADERSIVWMPFTFFLLVSSLRSRPSRWGFLILVLAFVVAIPNAIDIFSGLESIKVDALGWAEKQEFQQSVAYRWATRTQDHRMMALCHDVPVEQFLVPSFLVTDCARGILSHNLAHRWPMVFLAFPFAASLFVILSLSVGSRIKRGFIVYSLGIFWVISALSVLPPRYLIQFAPLLIIVIGMGLGAFLSLIPPRYIWIVLLGGGVSSLLIQPNLSAEVFEQGITRSDIQKVTRVISPNDSILDCSGTGLGLLLYPKHPIIGTPSRVAMSEKECLSEAQSISSGVVIVDKQSSVEALLGTNLKLVFLK